MYYIIKCKKSIKFLIGPGGAPNHVTCKSVTSSSLKVTWSAIDKELANGIILNYRITYSLDSSTGEHIVTIITRLDLSILFTVLIYR